MTSPRLTESRNMVFSVVRRALDAHGAEPKPPLTGEASKLNSTYEQFEPLLDGLKNARRNESLEKIASGGEELVVESLFFLARVMEISDLYSDRRVETPLTAACYFALGSYIEQESDKQDQWRDQSFEQLYTQAKKELEIIQENVEDNSLNLLIRNSVDFVLLVSIFYAAAISEVTDISIKK